MPPKDFSWPTYLAAFLPALLFFCVTPLAKAAEIVQLLDYGASWKFDQSGTDLGTAWSAPGFDDSTWASGAGVFGFPTNENILSQSLIRTPLNRFVNGSSGTQPITYYFRTHFTLNGSPQGVLLRATNLVDDGAVIFLNGQKIRTIAMPADPITYASLATRFDDVSVHGPEVWSLSSEALQQGDNVLAVEVHQSTTIGNDAIWGMSLWTDTAPVDLMPFGQVWRYHVLGTDLGTDWKAPTYDDSLWRSGPGPLGRTVSALPVPLGTQVDLPAAYTLYFRTTFIKPDVPDDFLLSLTAELDDGAVFYLNGSEILRVGIAAGTVTNTTPANRSVGTATLETFNLRGIELKNGTNLLAVEIHQSNPASLDAVMGLAAQATALNSTPLSITNVSSDLVTTEFASFALAIGVEGNNAQYQWFKDGLPIPGANRRSYSVVSAGAADTGLYRASVSNVFSTLSSGVINVAVIIDREPPIFIGVEADADLTRVSLFFSEPISTRTATNVGSYTLTNTLGGTLPIYAAILINGTNVLLTTAPREFGFNYLIIPRNLTDRGSQANLLPSHPLPIPAEQNLVGFNDEWSFYDPVPPLDELNLGEAWRLPNYDVTGWGRGRGAFWNGAVIPPVPAGIHLSQGAITSYFRTQFYHEMQVPDAELRLRHVVDDGCVLYLNGSEIARVNMPTGAIDYLTPGFAANPIEISPPVRLPSVYLQPGTNLLTAELHAFSSVAARELFAVELSLRVSSFSRGPVFILSPCTNVIVTEGTPVLLQPIVVGANHYQWFLNDQPIPEATNSLLAIPHASIALDGATFALQASNADFSNVASNIVFTVAPDLTPPRLLSVQGVDREILLQFSEALLEASATNRSHYSLLGPGSDALIIQQALVKDETMVRLILNEPSRFGTILTLHSIFDRALLPNPIAPPTTFRVGLNPSLVPLLSNWSFDDSGTDRGTSWREKSYDDSTWRSGLALLGRSVEESSAPFQTLLRPPSLGGPVTTYFRTHFTYRGGPRTLSLRYMVDDGAIFYLNGQELHRVRVPPGQMFGSALGLGVNEVSSEGPFPISGSVLVFGDNVLAGEVYQAFANDRHVAFAAELVGAGLSSRFLPLLQAEQQLGGGWWLRWDDPAYFLQQSTNVAGPWTSVSPRVNPYPVPSNGVATAPKFYRLTALDTPL